MSEGGVKRTRRRAPAGSAIEAAPDVLGDEGRANVLAGLLAQVAQKRFELEAIRVANDQELDDPVSGEPPTRADGTVNSYRLKLGEYAQQEQRLAKAYPGIIDRVRELVEQRARQAK